MPHGSVSQIIPAASEAVFDLLHDYDRRLEWDTLLSAAYLTDGITAAGVGATSVCVGRRSLGGVALKTIYVSYERPRLAAVKMINLPPWFDTWAAAIRHEDLGPTESGITYTWTFTARPRWLAWIVEPVMNVVFRWETRKRLAALRKHFSTAPGRNSRWPPQVTPRSDGDHSSLSRQQVRQPSGRSRPNSLAASDLRHRLAGSRNPALSPVGPEQ